MDILSLDTKPKDDIDGIFPQQIIHVFGIVLSSQKLTFLLG